MGRPSEHDSYRYDVIVVGAGHAGCEAALASARMGRKTALVTMNLDLLAHMPCNPSIGGSAKGHLVREIDALGGEMARNIDKTFIQVRMLNLSRGPAVWALRAQADKRLYSQSMKVVIESTPHLYLKQGHVTGLLHKGDQVTGVRLARGEELESKAVVLTTGTFLKGRILSGSFSQEAGRAGEFPADGLSDSLRGLGLELGRLQTNTPPRVDARTIHYELSTPQYGSDEPLYFSFDGPPRQVYSLPINPVYPIAHQTAWRPQVPCYLVRTQPRTVEIIRENLHRSPIAPGKIDALGPRYCPSIEEKVVRYPQKLSHQFFLEPEGWSTGEVYVQGCFTGLPYDVQLEILRSIPALEEVEMMRPGYAIEYDYVPSYQLKVSLETRGVHGLFHGGQINGTSGYEEAAAQGLLAGVNAARYAWDQSPLELGRDQAYLGVMVDDLVTKEITEPYRMLTSRAEYRLLLRQDNADLRLTGLAHEIGLVSDQQHAAMLRKREATGREIERLHRQSVAASPELNGFLKARGLQPLAQAGPAHQLLRRPGATYDVIREYLPAEEIVDSCVAEQVTLQLQYEGYIARQRRQADRARRLDGLVIPADLDYLTITGLRTEAREQLVRFGPSTLGQASRISGVNPADISVLMISLERRRRSNQTV